MVEVQDYYKGKETGEPQQEYIENLIDAANNNYDTIGALLVVSGDKHGAELSFDTEEQAEQAATALQNMGVSTLYADRGSDVHSSRYQLWATKDPEYDEERLHDLYTNQSHKTNGEFFGYPEEDIETYNPDNYPSTRFKKALTAFKRILGKDKQTTILRTKAAEKFDLDDEKEENMRLYTFHKPQNDEEAVQRVLEKPNNVKKPSKKWKRNIMSASSRMKKMKPAPDQSINISSRYSPQLRVEPINSI